MPRVTEGMFAEGAHTVDPREPLLDEVRSAKNDLDDLFAGFSPQQTQQLIPQQQGNDFGLANLDFNNKESLSEVWELEKRKQLDESRTQWAEQLWEEQKAEFENINLAHQEMVTPKITNVIIADDKNKWEAAKEKGQEIAVKAQEAGSSAVETIQQKGHEVKVTTEQLFDEVKEKTQEIAEKAQEKGAALKEKVQEKAADTKESVVEGFEAAKEKGAAIGEQIKEKAIEASDFAKEKLNDAGHKVEEWKDTAFEKGVEAQEGTTNVLSNVATHVKDAALTVGHAVADTISHVVEKLHRHDSLKDQLTEDNKVTVEAKVVSTPEQILAEDPKFATVQLEKINQETNSEFVRNEGAEQGRLIAEAPIMQPRDKTKSRFC